MDTINNTQKELSAAQRAQVLAVLKERFEKNMPRHDGLEWAKVQERLEAEPQKLWSLGEMESTGGEPDVVGRDAQTGEFIFYDCSTESPAGRRNTCYDQQARIKRKVAAPASSALEMAQAMDAELLTEAQYRDLQQHGEFDLKTSSWLYTPDKVRKLGGALFADRRYDTVFVYHNGADSYYGARGFRVALKV